MHVRQSIRRFSTTLSILIVSGLLLAAIATVRAAPPTSGFTITSSTSVQFWVHDAPWADLHYQVNGGGQLNVRMVANGSNHTFDVTARPAGATFRYSFTIGQFNAGAFDTAWQELTLSGSPPPPPPPPPGGDGYS